jgi:mitochondrial fission protein ELM1
VSPSANRLSDVILDHHPNSKPKFWVTCGMKATQEVLFNVGEGVILVEKYCDVCAKNVKQKSI